MGIQRHCFFDSPQGCIELTQMDIAEAVGLSQGSVSDLMSRKVKTTEYGRGLRILAAHKAAMRRAASRAAETTEDAV